MTDPADFDEEAYEAYEARVRPCPVCEGKGCEECGNTGERHRTHIDAGHGITLSVSGDAPLTPGARGALAALARVAFARMEAEARPNPPGGTER